MLRVNQSNALDVSINNDFQSGVHFHATGTGKSLIAFTLLEEFYAKYPKKNVIWLCEQKSILIQQFTKEVMTKMKKNYLVLNFAKIKSGNWFESVNSNTFWNKPLLLIINRAFLVSKEKYKKIRVPFGLIIHDECHSITNTTTQSFYKYFTEKYSVKCIGFSATPNLDISPYTQTLSHYSLYDGFIDNVILPPKIIWFKSNSKLNFSDLFTIIKKEVNKLVYKKIIVWCGMIDHCSFLANLAKKYFVDFQIGCDTSVENDFYPIFEKLEENAILFCAAKHREGSDIKNLDGCVFMDKVATRTPRTFVQCVGRVLRKDTCNKKTYGMVIDCCAKSSLELCNRINEYLCIKDIFPWNFDFRVTNIGNKTIRIQQLLLVSPEQFVKPECSLELYKTANEEQMRQIVSCIKREMPDNEIYKQRLSYELELFYKKNLISYLFRALDILKITENIPHVTRGSCGSSLLCYMLGISHVDPIVHDIKFCRFLNEYRDTLPDIDFDFPYHMRDEVFMKLNLKWPGQIARISNHVYFHEKSAKREALRKIGIKGFIGKLELGPVIKNLSSENKALFKREMEKINNSFRCFSLHCGGIVFYPEGIPQEFVLEDKRHQVIQQVTLNKKQISENKQFKIDILSSRALAQLQFCCKKGTISFDDNYFDKSMADMLASGDNIGITLGESPLMRKAFMTIKPKTISDIAVALAIIRPAAKNARNETISLNYDPDQIIYDDDVIDVMKKLFDCDDATADKYRRDFMKGKLKVKDKKIQKQLSCIRSYGFCKSHAFSYAQLVAKLTFIKMTKPKSFWRATLLHTKSSYRKWVHLQEAVCAGVNIHDILSKKNKSIYAEHRENSSRKSMDASKENDFYHLRNYGFWNMKPDSFATGCYINYLESGEIEFCGIIASFKQLSDSNVVLFLGVDCKKYIEVILTLGKKNRINSTHIGIKGKGRFQKGKKHLGIVEASIYKAF